MGIKYCKSCKKPMRPTDTHCKSCGKEYKNSPVIIVIIAAVIIAIGIAAYFLISNKDSSTVDTPDISAPVVEDKPVVSNWIYDSRSDPIDNIQTHAATIRASDFNTKEKVNSEFSIACQNNGGDLNIVISATYPVKTDSFTSDGPMARYRIKIDQNEPLRGVARAGANNTVIVLDEYQSKAVIAQLKSDSKAIFQMSSVKDTSLTYEADLSGATAVIDKLKEDCLSVPKSGV